MKNKGFTLIELLTVIAIIGILAGILIPTVGAVKTSAKKAKTKAQFSQWSTALGLFKQEYGYYPSAVATSGHKVDPTNFLAALSARDYKGEKAVSAAKAAGNKKAISFYSFSDSDIYKSDDGTAKNLVIDAFGNSDIAIFVDTNGDGKIDSDDGLSTSITVKGGNTEDGQNSSSYGPSSTDIPSDGVYGGVAFFSPGKGDSAKDIVFSWK